MFQQQGVVNKVWSGERKTMYGPKQAYSFEVDGVNYSGFHPKNGNYQLNNGDNAAFTFTQKQDKNGKTHNNVETLQKVNGSDPVVGQAPAPVQAAPQPPVGTQAVAVGAPSAPPAQMQRRGDSCGMAIKCACETLGAGATVEQIEERAKEILMMGDRLKHYEPNYELEYLKHLNDSGSNDDAEAFAAA